MCRAKLKSQSLLLAYNSLKYEWIKRHIFFLLHCFASLQCGMVSTEHKIKFMVAKKKFLHFFPASLIVFWNTIWVKNIEWKKKKKKTVAPNVKTSKMSRNGKNVMIWHFKLFLAFCYHHSIVASPPPPYVVVAVWSRL